MLIASGTPVAIALGIGGADPAGDRCMGNGGDVAGGGFAHQRLARLAVEAGMELDVSQLPRTPSGRIQRDAADALFDSVRAELEADPDNWLRWYRLARAYDYAGDRGRARETMRKAVALQAES